jgi:hypothetical protein
VKEGERDRERDRTLNYRVLETKRERETEH